MELLEIRDFLAESPAFRPLPTRALDALAHEVTIVYLRRGTTLPDDADGRARTLDVVRSGAVEIRTEDGQVFARRGEGECALASGALADRATAHGTMRIVAIEDTLLYRLPPSATERLCAAHPSLAGSLEPPGANRLRLLDPARADHRPARLLGAPDLLTTRLGAVVSRAPVRLGSRTPVREVATKMNEEHVTSMLLVDEGELVGIVTDRDLRRRVIVEGVSADRAVADIMTPSPIVADVESLAYDALLLMARHGIHHLPVVDGGTLVGLVTASDFVERRGGSTVRLAASIHRAPSIDSLAAERVRIDALYASLVRGGASAARIGRVTSGVVDALTIRLLELAETEGGHEIPEGLVWLVAGSQARREWHIGSIAVNAPLLDADGCSPAEADALVALARFVTEGLERCGFATGGASGTVGGGPDAASRTVRFETSGRLERVTSWLDGDADAGGVPPAALLDLRAVHGEHEALTRLHRGIEAALRDDARRVGRLARAALGRRPPLGFFRDAVLDERGEERATLDIATDAVRPIVDLARVLALACGDDPLNTRERLVRAVDGGELDRALGRDLDDALDFAAGVRARHHARQAERGSGGETDGEAEGSGREPRTGNEAGAASGDRIRPASLTPFERRHLEDVFAIVRSAQHRLAARHVR